MIIVKKPYREPHQCRLLPIGPCYPRTAKYAIDIDGSKLDIGSVFCCDDCTQLWELEPLAPGPFQILVWKRITLDRLAEIKANYLCPNCSK